MHFIHLGDSPFEGPWPRSAAPEFQKALNEKLGPHERIVHMAQQEHHSHKWIVITEELVMGPAT